MADDGMLLNFDIGGASIKPQVKFKGGRWRDRVRAQKSAKRRQDGTPSTPLHEGTGTSNRKPGGNDDSLAGFGDSGRPTKRQRIDGDSGNWAEGADGGVQHRRSGSSQHNHGGSNGKSQNITSRLFSSNPTPKTVFEDPPIEEAAPAEPSNAPLSEEASNFHALGLHRRIAQHLSTKLEMKAPTAIQKSTIPQLVKEDSDAFLQAETGSGKTLAYLLPIVHRIMALSQSDDGTRKDVKIHRNSGLFAIILAPTRELCKQIATVLEKLLRCAPWIVSTIVIGGESKKSEKARLRKGVNILIATPGRLTDHLDHTEVLDVGTVRWLVLDEGDRLMEMGFEDDIKTIVGKIRKGGLKRENKDGVVLDGILPTRRVTVLCSATMKMNVQKLGEISLEDAVHITAAGSDGDNTTGETNEAVFTAPSQLKQSYIIVPAKLRLVTLIALLKSTFARKGSVMKAIVFISCADSVDFHFELLRSRVKDETEAPDSPNAKDQPPVLTASTVAPAAYLTSPANTRIVLHKLHGSLQQAVRTATLASFTLEKDPAVLITTDISSRGLDVPAVDLVIEYDPAFAVSDHLHRIGRTARAGRPGRAALFLMPGTEEGYVSLLQSSSTITPQLYDTVLQKGLASPVELPQPPPSEDGAQQGVAAPQRDNQTWTARAEALQLHLEQRLLATNEGESASSSTSTTAAGGAGHANFRSRGHPRPVDSKLLDAARQAFRSHIRAYATHVRDERGFFDMTQLHLGHMAKSFGLREAPGGIGGGVQRRTYRPGSGPGQQHQKKGGAAAGSSGGGGGGERRGAGAGSDDEDGGSRGLGAKSAADEDAARRMREKMKAVMSSAEEFNIG